MGKNPRSDQQLSGVGGVRVLLEPVKFGVCDGGSVRREVGEDLRCATAGEPRNQCPRVAGAEQISKRNQFAGHRPVGATEELVGALPQDATRATAVGMDVTGEAATPALVVQRTSRAGATDATGAASTDEHLQLPALRTGLRVADPAAATRMAVGANRPGDCDPPHTAAPDTFGVFRSRT